MNFKINIDKRPNLVGVVLLTCEIILFALILIAIIHFVYWEMLSASYFRALGINILILLVCAYFNKEKR